MIGTTWQIYPLREFAAYATDWDRLNRLDGDLPILSADSIRTLIRHYGGDQRIAVRRSDLAMGEIGGKPSVVAIAMVEEVGLCRWQTWQPSQIPVTLLVHDRAAIKLHEIVDELARAIFGCLVFGITQADPTLMGRPDTNARRMTMDYIETPRIVVTGSFYDYWDARGNLKANLGKQRRRLERNGTLPRLEIVRDYDWMVPAVNDYARLEALGWKAREGTALEPGNPQCMFYADWMSTLSRKGEGFVAKYYFGDKLVACDFCSLRDGTLIILKTTYDEAERGNSPALLLLQDLLAQMWPQLRCIEFYGRTMDWHRRWSDDTRTMFHITAYRWAWVRRMRDALLNAASAIYARPDNQKQSTAGQST